MVVIVNVDLAHVSITGQCISCNYYSNYVNIVNTVVYYVYKYNYKIIITGDLERNSTSLS